ELLDLRSIEVAEASELFEAVDAAGHLYISVFLLSHPLLAKQMVNEESSCVSASRIALLPVR
ncbi:hypothetical protein, partial [Pseudomonas aeruginosa]|uniref:hypothetical protein n=1 Tax=Pseudomonas aeruginosa TaxID=287 RepID=UPI0038915DC2